MQTISPQLSMQGKWDPSRAASLMEGVEDPASIRIVVAEDSPLIRKQIKDSLARRWLALPGINGCHRGMKSRPEIGRAHV